MAGLPGLPPPGFSEGVVSDHMTDLGNINTGSVSMPQSSGLPGLPPPGFATKAPLSAGETFTGGILDILQKLSFSAGDEITAGGASLIDSLTGGPGYDARLAQARDLQSRYVSEHPYASKVNYLAALLAPIPNKLFSSAPGAAAVTGNIIKGAGLGAGYGGAAGFASGEGGLGKRLEEAETGAKWGAALGAGGQAIIEGVQGMPGALNSLGESGRKLELSAFGAGKNAIKKAINRMPDIIDESGNFKNPLNDAITSFRNEIPKGQKLSMDGESLLSQLETQTQKYGEELVSKLKAAEAKRTEDIFPDFKMTEDYIAQLPGAVKPAAIKLKNELTSGTYDSLDGSLLSVQTEKQRLGQVIKDTAWGVDAEGQLKVNILKRIRADLRKSVEDSYSAITGKPGTEIANLNKEIGKRETLYPLFKDILASGEARTPLKAMIDTLRTSGGVGQTIIAGAAAGGIGGLPFGGAAALANMYAQTPQGKLALSKLFRAVGEGKLRNLFGPLSKAELNMAPAANEIALEITPQVGLSPEIAKIQSESIAKLKSNAPTLIKKYLQENTNSNNVILLDTDKARALVSDSKLATGTHEAASSLVKATTNEVLSSTKTPQNVLILSGGPGAGKSLLAKNESISNAIKIDKIIKNSEDGRSLIDKALSNGKKVVFDYIDAPPELALDRAWKRLESKLDERSVPLSNFGENAVNAPKAALELIDSYKGNPRVSFRIWDNSTNGAAPKRLSIEQFQKLVYNRVKEGSSSINKRLEEILNNLYEQSIKTEGNPTELARLAQAKEEFRLGGRPRSGEVRTGDGTGNVGLSEPTPSQPAKKEPKSSVGSIPNSVAPFTSRLFSNKETNQIKNQGIFTPKGGFLSKNKSSPMEDIKIEEPREDFEAKASRIATDLGTTPENLFKVMSFETGGELDSKTKNKAGSGATGLIQFMPSTAKELTGADTKEAAIKIMESMTPTEQLDYVEKYLKPFKGRIKSLEDLYMAVLYPKAIGKDSDFALFKKGTTAYWQNKGLDLNRDGVITKLEAASKVKGAVEI